MTATYLGRAAVEKLVAAQSVIDLHLGSCERCGADRPCSARADAERVFARYRRLPRRTPGLTRVETPGAGFGWFAGR